MFPAELVPFLKKGTKLGLMVQFAFMMKANAAADFGPAALLPKGRYQAVVRFGDVSHIQQKYSSSGELQGPERMNKRFSNEFLRKIPDAKRLIHLMNSQNPRKAEGDALDMGELMVQGKAKVDYIAPQLARGMTSKWTLGMAIPVVNYKSDVTTANGGVNNAAELLNEYADDRNLGLISEGIKPALVKAVKQGPSQATSVIMNSSDYHYREISPRNEQFMGDVIVGSVYQIYTSPKWDLYLTNELTLPTGPKQDPDDLLSLPIFGKTALKNTLYNNFPVNYWLTFGLGLSYTWNIPDQMTKRVPRYDGDFLPPDSTKENLDRDPGDSVGFQLASIFKLTDYFDLGAGYEMEFRGKDRYSGGKGTSRYDLLENNTGQEAQYVKLKLTYSTVTSYFNGTSKIPYQVTYAFADMVGGVNIERQFTNELLLKFYF